MQMQLVKSNTIDVIGYDETTHHLRVSFKKVDKCLDFCHVPEHIFTEFLNSRSKNRYFKRHIQGLFPC